MVNGDAPIIEIVKHRWVISVWLCLNGHVRWSLQRFQRWITIRFYIQFLGQQDLLVWIVAHVQIITILNGEDLQEWHHEFPVTWHGVLFYIQGWSSSLRCFVWRVDIRSPYTLDYPTDYLRSRLPHELSKVEGWDRQTSVYKKMFFICWLVSSRVETRMTRYKEIYNMLPWWIFAQEMFQPSGPCSILVLAKLRGFPF